MNPYLVLILVIAAAGVVMFALDRRKRGRLRMSGKPAVAEVVDVRVERMLRSDNMDHDWVDAADRFVNERKFTYTLQYTVDGVTYTREWVRESREQAYNPGDKVEILYNPDNPKEIEAAAAVENSAPFQLHLLVILSIVVLAALYFLFRG